jgi:hypothetical protein
MGSYVTPKSAQSILADLQESRLFSAVVPFAGGINNLWPSVSSAKSPASRR